MPLSVSIEAGFPYFLMASISTSDGTKLMPWAANTRLIDFNSNQAAYIDGQIVDARHVEILAKLPPKIELLASLVGTLANPLRGLITVLSGNQSGLVRALNAIREQKAAASNA